MSRLAIALLVVMLAVLALGLVMFMIGPLLADTGSHLAEL